ncbi:MAG: signal peptidase I [Planctomycetota bacterium]|jgi:signal peptidase I
MAAGKTKKNTAKKMHIKDKVAEIANTFEWLITAFILAFLFRAFIMEAFRIPTGSMADTLMGAHFRMRCTQCGYSYEHGFIPRDYRLHQDTVPWDDKQPPRTRCPNCGNYPPNDKAISVSNGDRILVLKCIYQFFEPKQWDVVVFKNPLDPPINYIKRLVGRPGETVEIIDGDIYINGEISRKPPRIQNELWMPIYDNNYQPVNPGKSSFNYHVWRQPFRNIADSKWTVPKDNPTTFHLNSSGEQENTMEYDTSLGNQFKVTYAYNDVRGYDNRPYCSDLMTRFHADLTGPNSRVGITLSKYQNHYRAWVDSSGEMVIEKTSEAKDIVELARKSVESPAVGKPTLVKFANVDHRLIFQFGGKQLNYDLGRGPDAAGRRLTNIESQVKIFGSGQLTLSNVAVFRDIYYTASDGAGPGWATEGNPKTLGKNEFFVLGDNSPNSADGRWWNKLGIGNNGHTYPEGIVPRDYLVGKALFVYWPGGFNFPWPQSLKTFLLENGRKSPLLRIMYIITSLDWVPNVGRLRLIYGGSDKI